MPDFPEPLWKTRPIEYLVARRFPRNGSSALEQRLARKSAAEAARIASVQDQARAYRAELEKMSAAEVRELASDAYGEDTRKRQAQIDFEESQRFYNHRNANADFAYWALASYWSQDEAAALSLGRDPRRVTWEAVEPFVRVSAFAKSFADRREIIRRAIVTGQLYAQAAPYTFLAWAERLNFEIPNGLKEEVEKLGLVVGDWKTIADQRQEIIDLLEERLGLLEKHNAELSEAISTLHNNVKETSLRMNAVLAERDEKIADLETLLASGKRSSANSRERQSLLKLVIGIAVKGYGYDPKATRTRTVQEMSSDLQMLGLSLDEDTIRKYLNEAKELLPGTETE